MLRRKNNLGVLEINPYWGTTNRCFPSNSAGLSERGPTFSADVGGLQQLRDAWSDQYNFLSGPDKNALKVKADRTQTRINELKAEAGENVKEWQKVAEYGEEVGYDLDDEIAGRRFGEHWSAVGANLKILGVNRRAVFAEIDQLMVYSPSADNAVEMCQLKSDATKKYQEIIAEITPFHQAVSQGVADNLASKDSIMEMLFISSF